MDTLAVIADTHGNSWALDAVLADIRQRGIANIVNLGDSADADMDPGAPRFRLIWQSHDPRCHRQSESTAPVTEE